MTSKMGRLIVSCLALGRSIGALTGESLVARRLTCFGRASDSTATEDMRAELTHYFELDAFLTEQGVELPARPAESATAHGAAMHGPVPGRQEPLRIERDEIVRFYDEAQQRAHAQARTEVEKAMARSKAERKGRYPHV